MCEIYGFSGATPTKLNKYTNTFWSHAKLHKDGFGYYLADKDELYVNPKTACLYLKDLDRKDFTSKLALCHIRFKTHGDAKSVNCHPFTKCDNFGIKWTLIHNGYITDNLLTEAMHSLQVGDTDSERILMCIVESINTFYEHSWIKDHSEFLFYLYTQIETTLVELSSLGKTNLIFTDSKTNNMYVYINHPRTLFYLRTDDGIHFSTTPLSGEDWQPVKPYQLHIFNNGKRIGF